MEIISDMLLIIQERKGSIKPTHLMYKANLSHNQMKLYLDELMGNKLVQKEEGKRGNTVIAITKQGRDFLLQYNRMKNLEKTFGL